MITAVALSPALDVTYVVDELVEGGTHRPVQVERHPGGKAVNMARAAARLGAEVRVVAPLTEADAWTFRSGLARDGVGLVAVESSVPLRMCVSIASRASSLMTEVYEHPPALTEADVAAMLDAVRAEVGAGASHWAAVSGSIPPAALESLGDLIGSAPRAAVDTHGAGLAVAVERGPAVVKVNRAEAAALVGEAPLVDQVAELQSRTGGLAVVTDSTAGIAASSGSATWLFRLPDVVGTFSQGSGDSMLGGLLAALDAGADTVDALRLGIGAATANALVPGAGRFDPVMARRLADRVTTTSL